MNAQLQEELQAAFTAPIESVQRSTPYKVGVFLVAVPMVLLPIVYFALAAGVAYAVYWHVTHHESVLDDRLGYVLLVYVAPLVVGTIVVMAMIVPLIPRARQKDAPSYLITKASEPLFYDFVALICKSIEAPMPKHIELIMAPTAGAFLRHGFLSVFFPQDLGLLVGVPLIASLDVQQLASVLGHELGHFRQGVGIRVSHLIDTVHGWFKKTIYEGGSLDRKLDEFRGRAGIYRAIVLSASQLSVLLMRGILFIFLMLSYGISRFFSRQMEYDADQYGIRIGGTSAFESMLQRLEVLAIAWNVSVYMSILTGQKRVFAEDLVRLAESGMEPYALRGQDRIAKSMSARDAHPFDTHPSIHERIAEARMHAASGICSIKRPAKDLFDNFDKVSSTMTVSFYSDVLEVAASEQNLLPVDEYFAYVKDNHLDQLPKEIQQALVDLTPAQ